jgi:hypothetical protein
MGYRTPSALEVARDRIDTLWVDLTDEPSLCAHLPALKAAFGRLFFVRSALLVVPVRNTHDRLA